MLNTFEGSYITAISKCVDFMSKATNASICSVCDPTASKYFAGHSNFMLNSGFSVQVRDNCGDITHINNQTIFPYLKSANDLLRCSESGQLITSITDYKQATCTLSAQELIQCIPEHKDGPIAPTNHSVRALMNPQTRKTQQTKPKPAVAKPAVIPITAVEQQNCYVFASRILNGGLGKVDPCSMGDPDFVRGVYMN